MKIRFLPFVIALAAIFAIQSCADSNSKSVRDAARQSLPQKQNVPPPPPPPSAPVTTSSNIGSDGTIQHYYCPNNCEGSGGDAQGTCPTCGTAYVHNAAWHTQNQPTTQIQHQTQTQTTTTPTTAEPPQNAAGVWHYTCSNGCSGGAGSAIACANCGVTLVHNTAYHN